jgi:nucleotide-binding universal stress UspA family protein
MRKILVPVRGDGKGDNVVAHAAALARRMNYHIQISHCRPRAKDLMPFGVPVGQTLKDLMLKQISDLADQEELDLREKVSKLCKKLNLKMSDTSNENSTTASYVEKSGRQVDVIRHHGRLASLIAVAQPDRDQNLGSNTLKAALFHTSRPVLMCPPQENPPEVIGAHIAVAWNGSLEATRAVVMSKTIISQADKVTILTAGVEQNTPSEDELVEYLTHWGVSAEIEKFEKSKIVAKDLLAKTAEVGADLLVMGAYGDSHERETLFGGNTQHIVDHAKMPVILVH